MNAIECSVLEDNENSIHLTPCHEFHPYSHSEIEKLTRILELVQKGANEQQMTHWGNHSDYSKGW
jgi:hypothetical protein